MNKDIPYIESLPPHWEIIQNRFLFHYDGKKVGNDYSKYQLLSLTTSGVRERDINATGGKVPTSYENYQTVKKGQMIFCLFDLDCSAVFSGISNYDGMITSAYDVFSSTGRIRNLFADYWFKYVFTNRYYKIFSKNIRFTITGDMFRSIKTPVPPVDEQEHIGSYLHEQEIKIDELITNVQSQIENLKTYKQSLISEVVTKGLDPTVPMKDSDVDWIGDIPAHWGKLRVKYIGDTQNGISKGGEYFGSGYPFVSYSDVYKNMELPCSVSGLIESTETERENYSVKKGDIFFTRTSETIEEVGFSSVCAETIKDATFAGFLIRLRPFNDALTTQYAKYYFRGEHIRRYLVKEMNLVTRASLGQGLLKAMAVLIPPHDEQIAIAEYLDIKCSQVDRLIAIKQAKIEKLNEYKKSLIYEYVTGEKEV